MSTIARYVQRRYAKPAYATESFNVRFWPGLSMITDALQLVGYEVDYCLEATAHLHKVILVSITGSCDWWSYLAERERWRPGDYTVIVGGPGVLNVRPFLRWFDVAVFGRGEEIIAPLVRDLLAGHRLLHPSVCYADDFQPDRIYRIAQAERLWPHRVRLENGQFADEKTIGCQRRCLFCAYTWHRRNIGRQSQSAITSNDGKWAGAVEHTIFDLANIPGAEWKRVLGGDKKILAGLDGFSERLRFLVAKPITRIMLRTFLRNFAISDCHGDLKLFCIVGYPGENEDDYAELVEDIEIAESTLPQRSRKRLIELQTTPFKAMPATPAACWPMSCTDYRFQIAAFLTGTKGRTRGGQFYDHGRCLWARTSLYGESLGTIALETIVLRGTEADSENVGRVARTSRFWSARSIDRLDLLAKNFDLDTLFGGFTAATLPTRYLRTYARVEKMWDQQPWLNMATQPSSYPSVA